MTKHTPGPWRVERHQRGRIVVVEPEGCTVAQIVANAGNRYVPHNASLIAAAPDLLAALLEIVAISDRKHDAWDRARAAIAKVTGEK